jgi:hypothetical protein
VGRNMAGVLHQEEARTTCVIWSVDQQVDLVACRRTTACKKPEAR